MREAYSLNIQCSSSQFKHFQILKKNNLIVRAVDLSETTAEMSERLRFVIDDAYERL